MQETRNKYYRYKRQTVLKEFGTEAQDKLFCSSVVVIGAGGLGCPAMQYLAAAGVGTIGIVDFDKVELSNLQRQTLYIPDDIGRYKAAVAAEKLKTFNPDIQFNIYTTRLTTGNALEILQPYDIIIDGTDNFSTRYLINDACVLLKKPLIYGAVLQMEGQVGVFNLLDNESSVIANYRDLFPQPPLASTAPSCNEAGVLGVLPGVIGTMQAAEAIKIITGIGKPLCNKILSCNVSNNMFYELSISPSEKAGANFPATPADFKKIDYDWFCGMEHHAEEITISEFEALMENENIQIIDVREADELPKMDVFNTLQIPLSRFAEGVQDIDTKSKIVVLCQSGMRSLKAVKLLKEKFPDGRFYSLAGGILEWEKHQIKISK